MSLQNSGPILIVGGCGFLGRYIIQDLLTNYNVPESQIHAFDSAIEDNHKIGRVTYHQGDITVRSDVEKVLVSIKPAALFHLVSPKAFIHDLAFFMKVNVDGTRNLVEVSQKTGTVKAFLYTSSSSVVHNSIGDLRNVDETAPVLFMPEQQEPYHHTKALAETLVLEANNQSPSHMRTVALRPSGLFGKGDLTATKPIIDNAKAGKYKFQIGDGSNLFDWTYIENAARAHVLAAEALLRTYDNPTSIAADMKVDGEAFFITNGEPVPFWDFVRNVGAAAGYPTPKDKITVLPKNVGIVIGFVVEWATYILTLGTVRSSFTWRGVKYSTQVRVFNIDKARKRLGYKPFVTMDEAIRKSVPDKEE